MIDELTKSKSVVYLLTDKRSPTMNNNFCDVLMGQVVISNSINLLTSYLSEQRRIFDPMLILEFVFGIEP